MTILNLYRMGRKTLTSNQYCRVFVRDRISAVHFMTRDRSSVVYFSARDRTSVYS
ncbi:hypothetical protein C0J52_10264 [Blattella germanica]|nr:hypothetical protein C0J52_10264 [Blattella germanica]